MKSPLPMGMFFCVMHYFHLCLLAHLPSTIDPKPSTEVIRAGEDLKFRDFLTVALVVDEKFAFPDNWVYIHEPHVKVGRVQNYGSWSPYLVKDGKTCLGLEYFVTKNNDELWTQLMRN